MSRRVLVLGALLAGPMLAAGCESTKERAAKVSAGGSKAFEERDLEIRRDRDVRVLETTVLTDPNGTAVVVEMRNEGKESRAQVPVSFTVRGQGPGVVYRNNDPGLQASLLRAPVLPAGHKVTWIHDQVLAPGGTRASAIAGTGKPVAGELPVLTVTKVRLAGDPVSGLAAAGKVRNDSEVTQTDLVVYAVARKGDRLVAAGRAIVPRLAAGRSAGFRVFFIGNPKGARLGVSVPPSVLS